MSPCVLYCLALWRVTAFRNLFLSIAKTTSDLDPAIEYPRCSYLDKTLIFPFVFMKSSSCILGDLIPSTREDSDSARLCPENLSNRRQRLPQSQVGGIRHSTSKYCGTGKINLSRPSSYCLLLDCHKITPNISHTPLSLQWLVLPRNFQNFVRIISHACSVNILMAKIPQRSPPHPNPA
ncbi:hypothetical protein BDR07DRAFT_601520 [Suillus spraguei]|nr:hypothetical protein BDR07DRAFT_601520 [Suillus spraguei]